VRGTDYRFAVHPPRLATVTETAPGGAKRAGDVLSLLARAVRQFHTYPAASPMCLEAVTVCLDALVTIDDRHQLHARVSPHALVVDDMPLGAGTMVEQELARRLHRAGVSALVIERGATARDLTRFCCDLLALEGRGTHRNGSPASPATSNATAHAPRLHELLAEHGVEKVAVQMAQRPEVLTIGDPSAPVVQLVEHEHARWDAAIASGAAVAHLYPPDKGWVRIDPGAPLSRVSLADLAVLVDDPGALATMLMRLTDEELPESGARDVALAQKFSDIATVFSGLDPRLARVMFGKLSRAVLELEEDRRRELLRRTILPALLDGKIDGSVLRDFPDVDLADSLCLLLDLETAAPEVLATALDRLELSDERRASVAPLLEQRLQERREVGAPARGGADEYARKLIDVRHTTAKSFAEFASFDLAVDEPTVAAVEQLVEAIRTTDTCAVQLRCLGNLVRIEPNPVAVAGFLTRATSLLADYERQRRWPDMAAWIAEQGRTALTLHETRPDVAEAIDAALAAFWTEGRASHVLDLAEDEAWRPVATRVVAASGASIVPSLVACLATASADRWRTAVQVLCADPARVAPALGALLANAPTATARAIVRILGHAGPKYVKAVGEQLAHRDEQVVREALRALARMATAQAAAYVGARVRDGSGWLAAAAEETLWHFPAAEARRQVRDLLERKDFIVRQPAVAGRLIDRLAQTGAAGLESTLADIAGLRFRVWKPAVVRVARKAHALAGARS
jgi:hypothetical protein